MPNTYEYECENHGLFERREPIQQVHKADCPICGISARRKYESFGFRYANPLFHQDGSYEEK